MDGAWLHRMRWRRRGAWLWPGFVALTIADAAIGHLLPPLGESQTIFSAALVGMVLNVIFLILLSRPSAMLICRFRPDLPTVVARDYGGTTVLVMVFAVLLAIGLSHRSSVLADQRAMREATARAEAWIGDHAPAEFRGNVQLLSTVEVQARSVYRACAMNDSHTRTYCVIVKTGLPFGRSVVFDGYEPNYLFVMGTN